MGILSNFKNDASSLSKKGVTPEKTGEVEKLAKIFTTDAAASNLDLDNKTPNKYIDTVER